MWGTAAGGFMCASVRLTAKLFMSLSNTTPNVPYAPHTSQYSAKLKQMCRLPPGWPYDI
jgi:hypothetical protein